MNDMTLKARRSFLQAGGALALGCLLPGVLRAASTVPIADSHTHIGLFSNKVQGGTLKAQMQEAGVSLLAWTISADGRWTRRTDNGIQQVRVPEPGEQAAFVREKLAAMRGYLDRYGPPRVLKPEDLDASRAGTPQVVMALEGASFVADGIELLDEVYAQGVRHLQLMHYIRSALGDFQTEAPEHNGLTELGARTIQACNRMGILVDLAHSTQADMDRALQVSKVPMIWSHSSITGAQYTWQRSSAYSRLLYIDYAKKIADSGGAIGLWALRNTVRDSPAGYATELMRMVDLVGAEHVMFGTDTDGMGPYAAIEQLIDLRRVADELQQRGMDDKSLRAVCFGNYARCLKAAMVARAA
jgi:membrane dipeptidase